MGSDPALTDDALLALLLRRGASSTTSARLCRRLLRRFGGLRGLLSASLDELLEAKLDRPRAAVVIALPELARRYFEASLPVGECIGSPRDTDRFLRARLRELPHELFCCLFLDNRHRVIDFVELFRGTIDGTSVYPREVVKEALAANAAAVILAHNHPSGVAEPSRADQDITARLKRALDLVDIQLLDHLIIGDGRSTSFASRGLL